MTEELYNNIQRNIIERIKLLLLKIRICNIEYLKKLGEV
jgi:hypothetical protein